jgi:hypothetical protein
MRIGSWLACAGLAIGGAVRADVTVLTSTRDNTMYISQTGSLSSGAGPTMFSGETNIATLQRALVRFDLSAIPPGSTVTAVQLSLHLSRTIAGDVSISIYRALQDWGEGTSNAGVDGGMGAPATPGDATWLHRFYNTQFWSAPGGAAGTDYASAPSATASVGATLQNYTWGSTQGMVADAQAWVGNPASNFGWFIIGDETALGTSKRFDTREATSPTVRPTLTVTFTPPSCYANCDGSTVPPILNANDFQCFLNNFAAGLSSANCDGSTVPPVLNANDFQCFLNAYAAGCS